MSNIQMIFDDGELKPAPRGKTGADLKRLVASKKELKRRARIRAVCPFCAHISTLDKFTFLTKELKIARRVRCPRCKVEMTIKTTQIFDRGPLAYSEWYWNGLLKWHSHKKKVDHENVKKVVRELGFSKIFWDVYRTIREGRASN